jgi:hypothetical protein
MTRFLDLCRFIAAQNDAVNGPGGSRADSIAMGLGLVAFAVFAVAIAAITGDA